MIEHNPEPCRVAPVSGCVRHSGKNPAETAAKDVILVAEMLVEGRAADVGEPDDVRNADVLVAAFQDKLVEGGDNRFPRFADLSVHPGTVSRSVRPDTLRFSSNVRHRAPFVG